jgi:selenium metabolism protein YedF
MNAELDCRGMNCPAPVLHVRDALEKEAVSALTVLVDNEAAWQNVRRFLEHRNFQVNAERQGDEYRIVAARMDEAGASGVQPVVPVLKENVPGTKKIMVLVTSEQMGRGDDGLGDMLMFNFLKTLKEMGSDLWCLAFVNGGVKFTARDSEAVPILQELAGSGVQVLACGACLAYFHILDSMQVGDVTNMLDIVTNMKHADSVVTI